LTFETSWSGAGPGAENKGKRDERIVAPSKKRIGGVVQKRLILSNTSKGFPPPGKGVFDTEIKKAGKGGEPFTV
jgi:hypothetical protein